MTLPAAFTKFYIKIINAYTSYIIILFGICIYKVYYFRSSTVFHWTTIYNQYIHILLLEFIVIFLRYNIHCITQI